MHYNCARNSIMPNVKVGKGPRNSCTVIQQQFQIIIFCYVWLNYMQTVRNKLIFLTFRSDMWVVNSVFPLLLHVRKVLIPCEIQSKMREHLSLMRHGKNLESLWTHQGYRHGTGRQHNHCWAQQLCPFQEAGWTPCWEDLVCPDPGHASG